MAILGAAGWDFHDFNRVFRGDPVQPVHFVRRAPVQQVGNVTLPQGSQDCVPCGSAGCEDQRESRSDCLASITPEQVLERAWRVLGAAPAGEAAQRRPFAQARHA